MNWLVRFLPEAESDLKNLAGNQRLLVAKAIEKVRKNPLSTNEGGYGKPLGNRAASNLSGFLKIKLKSEGIRIVYKLIRTDKEMLIVIIGARADEEVYETAYRRIRKHGI